MGSAGASVDRVFFGSGVADGENSPKRIFSHCTRTCNDKYQQKAELNFP